MAMKNLILLFVLFAACHPSAELLHADDATHTIVAFGDSTTAKRGPLPIYSDILRTELPIHGLAVRVINSGIGGNHTDQARTRFEADVLKHNPDTVVIQFGINDAAVDVWKDPPATQPRVDVASFGDNLKFFVRRLRSKGIAVVLMTPNPMRWTLKLRNLYGKPPYDPGSVDGFNVLLNQYAEVVRAVARSESVALIDVSKRFTEFGDQQGNRVDDLLSDGMHPNERGHRLIADQLIEQMVSKDVQRSLIASISKETLWRNRDRKGKTWFHPRACAMPDSNGKPIVFMNLQEIGGSDYFGQVHWTTSSDLGKSWSDPIPIEAFGRDPIPGRPDDLKAAVCDVTPQYHAPSGSVIALGHVVFYKGDYFARKEQLPRYPVYATRAKDGTWSPRKIMIWNDPRGGYIYSNNCGQRLVLPSGDVQMSFTFGPDEKNRMVAGVRATFDGRTLEVAQVGPPLHNRVGRGLLEPSVTQYAEKYWMTMRAEDDHGYVSVSDDGLNWESKRTWAWDDGTPLTMSSTQQHWLTHSDGLFLVYTRKDISNENVIRWRSPLWVAQVDVEKRCLIKSTERIVLPLVGNGIDDADNVAMMGNFNVTNVSPQESWITVGEVVPRDGYKGDVLLARIRWSRPNQLPLW
jgi:lysophospholipase L1-like esterase